MLAVYKLLFFLIVFTLTLMAGYASFRYLTRKINESKTGWQILVYSLLLLVVNSGLFFGGLFVLIKSYGLLMDGE